MTEKYKPGDTVRIVGIPEHLKDVPVTDLIRGIIPKSYCSTPSGHAMTGVSQIGYVPKDTRWKATVVYRVTEDETRTVIHHVMELHELQGLIEYGPTFCAILDFRIEYCGPRETIEESRK